MKKSINNGIKSGIFYGIAMTIYFFLQKGNVISAVVGGVVGGVIFGFFMGAFVKRQSKKIKNNRPQIIENKTIIMEGPANLFKKFGSSGGWLFLTSEELVFKPHSLNIGTHELVIHLDQITNIHTTSTLGLINNGLQIVTDSNAPQKFVVNNNSKWAEKIKEAGGSL